MTRNPITTLSLAFSLRLSSVTSTLAVAPAGITAPFEPLTAFVTLAVKRSPTWLVFVQIDLFDARLRVDPAAIVPVLAPEAVPEERVTVLPLEVTVVVGRRVVVVGVRVVVVVVRGVVVLDVDVFGVAAAPAGTSVN